MDFRGSSEIRTAAHSNRTRDRAFHSGVRRDVDIRSPRPVGLLCISAVRVNACCSAASVRAWIHGPRRGCGHRLNRRLRAIPCRRSPLNFTASRVLVGRAIHILVGVLVRWRCRAHRWDSQRFESSWIGLFTWNRRSRLIAMPLLTVGIHSVPSCRGSGCSHRNRHARLIDGCRSPLNFTVFRVVAGWAAHTRIGILVRARAGAHHRNSQGF